MGNHPSDSLGNTKVWDISTNDALAFNSGSGGSRKGKTDFHETSEYKKPPCNNIKDYQFFNLQVALEVLKIYADLVGDGFIHEIQALCKRLLFKCQFEFKESDSYGAWNFKSERMELSNEISQDSLAIATLLVHEGLHAQEYYLVDETKRENYEPDLNGEIEGRWEELKMVNTLISKRSEFVRLLNSKVEAKKDGTYKPINIDSFYYTNYFKAVKRRAPHLEANKMLDIILAGEYAQYLTADWIVKNLNRHGGLVTRGYQTIIRYLKELSKAMENKDSNYSTFIKILQSIKDRHPAKAKDYFKSKKVINWVNLQLSNDDSDLKKWLSDEK